jgi:hypothetical protein
LVYTQVHRLLFHTALRTTAAGRQTSPTPHSPNGSWREPTA